MGWQCWPRAGKFWPQSLSPVSRPAAGAEMHECNWQICQCSTPAQFFHLIGVALISQLVAELRCVRAQEPANAVNQHFRFVFACQGKHVLAGQNHVRLGAPQNRADFVFADDYELMPLNELEQHIERDRHLPDIPSAATMQKNGVGIAALQTILLQKIEELTLYTLQQQKELEELRRQLAQK